MRLPPTAAIFSAMIGVVTDVVARSVDALDSNMPTAARVENYAVAGCTDEEIAERYLISVDYLRACWPDQLRRGRALHRVGLRIAQYNHATRGNGAVATLLIWLGRNVLGQSNDPAPRGRPLPEEHRNARLTTGITQSRLDTAVDDDAATS